MHLGGADTHIHSTPVSPVDLSEIAMKMKLQLSSAADVPSPQMAVNALAFPAAAAATAVVSFHCCL